MTTLSGSYRCKLLIAVAAAAVSTGCSTGTSAPQGSSDAGEVAAEPDAFSSPVDAAPPEDPAWALVFGGAGYDEAWGVATSDDGFIYVVGVFSKLAAFQVAALESAGETDVFVAAIDGDGTVQWVRGIGGEGHDLGEGIAVDSDGNVYVTGTINGSSPVADGNLDCSTESADAFLVSFTPSGDFRWGRCLGGDDAAARGRDLAVSENGTVYFAGWSTGSGDFGGDPIQSTTLSGPDAIVAAYDSDGGHLWSKGFGGQMSDTANKLIVDDSDGSIYVTGSFIGPANFAGQALAGVALSFDTYLLRLSSTGNLQWVREFSGPGDEEGLGLGLEGGGHVGFTGVYEGPVQFGDDALTSVDKHDLFVASFDNKGVASWSAGYGGVGFDQALDMAGHPDPGSPYYVVGRYDDTLFMGDDVYLSTNGGFDGFCAAIAPDGAAMWGVTLGGEGNDLARATATLSGGAAVVGLVEKELVIGEETIVGLEASDAFVARLYLDREGAVVD